MKNFVHLLMVITVMTVSAGCGATTKELSRMGQSEKTGVFTEVISDGSVPAGYADVVIKASLKTPLAGYYSLESKKSARGKAVYHFLINIDGQAVLWHVEGQKHLLPEYVDGKTNLDPDAGEGMKYMLEKKVRLAAGSHKVFFGLPDEPYFTTADLSMKSEGLYVLEFKPDYRYKTVPTRIPTFLKGVDKFEVKFKEITPQDR
jgi:hypothetical protein